MTIDCPGGQTLNETIWKDLNASLKLRRRDKLIFFHFGLFLHSCRNILEYSTGVNKSQNERGKEGIDLDILTDWKEDREISFSYQFANKKITDCDIDVLIDLVITEMAQNPMKWNLKSHHITQFRSLPAPLLF